MRSWVTPLLSITGMIDRGFKPTSVWTLRVRDPSVPMASLKSLPLPKVVAAASLLP
jgi:hypothetical protein